MLGKLTKNLISDNGPVNKAQVKQEIRRINTEKFTGGRGATEGVLRTEKRNGGRIRTSSLECDLGKILDLSPGGARIVCKKKPKEQVGASVSMKLKAEDEEMSIRGKIVWIRVDETCAFQMGIQFEPIGPTQKRRLMELAATGQASEGLSRGWSPMFKPV